jgi:CheY-like chemotaxis protein
MKTILVVDDSVFARKNLCHTLGNAGFNCLEAESGQKAIGIIEKFTPDLVTLDLLMPEMNGLETLGHLRKVLPQAKFLVITADVQKLTREELLDSGAHAFLNKPVSKQELLTTIEQLIAIPVSVAVQDGENP